MAPGAGETNNLGRDVRLPYDAMMPKEDDIEHILNSLDHLLREGFEDDRKRQDPVQKPDEDLPETEAAGDVIEEEIEIEPLPMEDVPPNEITEQGVVGATDVTDDEGEIFDESAAGDSSPAPSGDGPRRLLLSEDMLDEELPSESAEATPDAEPSGGADARPLTTEQADEAWLEKHGRKPVGDAGVVRLLKDEQVMADFAQRVSADVAARLAEQLPRLVEESLMERLAELDPEHSQ